MTKPGEEFTHESIIGSKFSSFVVETAKVGDYEPVIPAVAGAA
ncbi:proline racemase family protein [Arthrobacter pascens]|nr:proline racemase family protein [Arthrobacter pascens]MBN3497890.1 proline racemase family protein [Arthrobacter pascens]